MPSPFPGMNPYLEQESVWQNFHQHFCAHCLEVLVPQVRPKYIVKLEENVYLHELPARERLLLGRPDLSVSRIHRETSAAPAAVLTPAPVYVNVPIAVDIERQSCVEIRDRADRQLIAAIELLSPSNKRSGPDREQYVAKRRQLLNSPVHFVEIDLLRGGPRMPLDDLPPCEYYALVSRYEERPRGGIWPLRLRDQLPSIPIPLRAGDPDARLDLQAILHRLYDAAGYEDYIYTGQPQPPLPPED
ncbi:MAG: DUF4058 family protein, partial [Planctomycetia bacterium]|nr:DUF4058 family protein [Planctomycetia bacterium]